MIANNEIFTMTRRYPSLPGKVLRRDSGIVSKIITSWEQYPKDTDRILQIFLKEHTNLSDERYWELMRTVWILCGNSNTAEKFINLMQSARKQRFYFSTPEEAAKLRAMPDFIKIWRATNDVKNKGISWTISFEYVRHFQQLFNKKIIVSGLVSKKDVFAFIERNNESEVLVLDGSKILDKVVTEV